MRHEISLTGHTYKVRPITDDDADFVVALRNDPELNQYLHNGATTVAAQIEWFARYYQRPGDYYFVIERKEGGDLIGLVAVYDVDDSRRHGEWGRWILRSGSVAAVESAWLIYRIAFEILHLEAVFCRTVAENRAVVSFHDSCGIVERRMLPDHFEIDGRSLDAIEHRVDRHTWEDIAGRLNTLAKGIARKAKRA